MPCVTLRDSTERPETVEINANILAGASSAKIVECVKIMLSRGNNWQNPFGDGTAGEKITNIIYSKASLPDDKFGRLSNVRRLELQQ